MAPPPQFEGRPYRPADKLSGRVALVTGGDSGIGRAVATLFAREGARVGLVYLPSELTDAEETARVIDKLGGEALLMAGDVGDSAFCAEAVRWTRERFGALHILVNNAAYQQHKKSLLEIADEDWDRTFRTNIHGYFYMARAAVPHMSPGDAIINCGSIVGLEGSPHLIDYASTKGAIHAFTKSLAQNLAPRGIRVNCVSPGPVWTPLNVADKPAGQMSTHGQHTAFGRPAQPDEIAPAFVFFASGADSSYITGEVLTLLGGGTRAG